MSLTFTNINPADGSPLSRTGPIAFTLSSDVRDGQGVRVGVYIVASDTEETAWNGATFVGKYTTLCTKSGNDFILRRRGGWPTGGVALRVSEVGSTEVMTIWTDGSGAPNNAVGVDGDYYLRTSNGAVYKRSGGVYSTIFTPVSDPADDSITNAKLTNVATQTLKGRTTAGTGDPEDLTATQATAILSPFVGDSGAGGTKGLVPAPASGDAAANKYLKANGLWATVPSSGLTVQEEGASQTTTATTFNFVGAGVTASGGGAVATITVPGGSPAPIYVNSFHPIPTNTSVNTTLLNASYQSVALDLNARYLMSFFMHIARTGDSQNWTPAIFFDGLNDVVDGTSYARLLFTGDTAQGVLTPTIAASARAIYGQPFFNGEIRPAFAPGIPSNQAGNQLDFFFHMTGVAVAGSVSAVFNVRTNVLTKNANNITIRASFIKLA